MTQTILLVVLTLLSLSQIDCQEVYAGDPGFFDKLKDPYLQGQGFTEHDVGEPNVGEFANFEDKVFYNAI